MLSINELAIIHSAYTHRYRPLVNEIVDRAVAMVGDSRFGREAALKLLGTLRQDDILTNSGGELKVTERGAKEFTRAVEQMQKTLSMMADEP